MGTVESDTARYEAEIARADAENAALERACADEVQRLEALTVKELLAETDIVKGRIKDFCGFPPAELLQIYVVLDLDAVLAVIAEHNVRNASHD